ncbi:MAG: hypothetical protein GF381_02655 [Candidatus Pacebacteria bacterium]|nr:hypothetical protein [Candidatus Paceibacterota bacterium]
MPIVISLITSVLQFIGLVLLLGVERVIGLPWIFSLFSLIWLNRFWTKPLGLVGLTAAISLLLAAAYDLSWFISFGLMFGSLAWLQHGQLIVKSQRKRFVISLIALNLVIVWISQLRLSYLSLVQLIISYLLVVAWMKVLKLDQDKTSFSTNIQLINES